MATEYTTANYPGRSGFSPHSLCRMRDFYQMYEGYLEALKQVMEVGWTQNIVILEADLDMGAGVGISRPPNSFRQTGGIGETYG